MVQSDKLLHVLPMNELIHDQPIEYLLLALHKEHQPFLRGHLRAPQETLRTSTTCPTTGTIRLLHRLLDPKTLLETEHQLCYLLPGFCNICPYRILGLLHSAHPSHTHHHTRLRGHHHLQIININLIPHTRNLMGRNYHQLLTDPEITVIDPTLSPSDLTPRKVSQANERTKWRGPAP